ncbi:hypothetical protein Poly51_25960 [Rubripirellula tenax]|uniref:DUF6690 domain-containing protein n=1 Tax=Rubripirellula tenax TaxID=2528015 RepID=A0A5C6FAP3_9BACT|nr:DUF6690 family protein [Rubripirellula tenax]TWU56679.1 hypothetical protein Poly51_25960 [Rubripirellula tenax]
MFSRVQTAALLVAAAGGPYVASETEWGRSAMTVLGETNTASYRGDLPSITATGAAHAHHEVEALRGTDARRYRLDEELARKLGAIPTDPAATPTLAGTRVSDLREVIRFDISPDWVLSRFSRVSTVLADLRLEGLRVPIVTGTRADDLAGTLTYYFDQQGKLQRATFHGFTGDPGRLVQTMISHYGLKAEPALEAGVYTKRWNGMPVHFVRLTHAPVVYSDAVHQKYTVFLELNQPSLVYGISAEARRIGDADRHSGRW